MPDTKAAVSLEEFWKMSQQTDDHLELVDGEVLRMPLPGAQHGLVQARLVVTLQGLIPKNDALVFPGIGIILSSGNVRGPDTCLISADSIRASGIPTGWWTGAIGLAVEVIGTEDRVADLDRKTEEYFSAGARQVWRVNPETRKVAVYRSPKDIQVFDDESELVATDLYPSLRFPVRDLFD